MTNLSKLFNLWRLNRQVSNSRNLTYITRSQLLPLFLHVLSVSHRMNCSNHAWPGTGSRDIFSSFQVPTSSWGKGNPYTVYLNLETIFGKIHYAQSISWPPGFPTSNPYSARAQFTQPHWIKRSLLSSRLLHVLSASHKKNCSNHAWPGTGRRDFFCSFQSALQVLRRLQKKVLQEWFASSQSQVKESPTLSLRSIIRASDTGLTGCCDTV